MNYNILGNSLPHLHVHLVPRYAEDRGPSGRFAFPEEDPCGVRPVDALVRDDAARLREAAGQAPFAAFLYARFQAW